MSLYITNIKTRLGATLILQHPNINAAQKEAEQYSDACEYTISLNGKPLISHINYQCVPSAKPH